MPSASQEKNGPAVNLRLKAARYLLLTRIMDSASPLFQGSCRSQGNEMKKGKENGTIVTQWVVSLKLHIL